MRTQLSPHPGRIFPAAGSRVYLCGGQAVPRRRASAGSPSGNRVRRVVPVALWRRCVPASPGAEPGVPAFLPSFALRRKAGANVLGGTRMAGFLYTENTAFVPYYVTPESEGLYAGVEQRTFRSESLLCGRTPFVLYTGAGSLEQVLETVTAPRSRKEKSTTDAYPDALDKFGCPAGILPLNEDGLRQLRIMTVPGYRLKLLHGLLGKMTFCHPKASSRTGTANRPVRIFSSVSTAISSGLKASPKAGKELLHTSSCYRPRRPPYKKF